jgi:hypothetical protein
LGRVCLCKGAGAIVKDKRNAQCKTKVEFIVYRSAISKRQLIDGSSAADRVLL